MMRAMGGQSSVLARVFAGPRLQLLNLGILLMVVVTTLDFPTPLPTVLFTAVLAGAFDAVLSRWRHGGAWRVPWSTLVGATGACLLLDGVGLWPFVALAALMVGSKHLLRWRGHHLFNPNNFAAVLLLLAGAMRIGVNEWGAAPQALALIALFGSVATLRVNRFDLAVAYLTLSLGVYAVVAFAQGWGAPTVVALALSPLNVMIGFFAITDPATSPSGRWAKLAFAALLVALAVPATLAGHAVAPVFALFAAAPQRHLLASLFQPAPSHEPVGGATP